METLQFLSNSLWVWLASLFGALIGSSVANGAFGIPFGNVVDVVLSLQLAFLLLITFSVAFTSLTGGVIGIVAGIPALIVCLLLPFGAIAGFRLYALVTGVDLNDAGFVYVPITEFYVSTLQYIGFFPANSSAAVDPILRGLIPIDRPQDATDLKSAIARVESALIVTSLALSFLATLLLRAIARRSSKLPTTY